MVRSPRDTERTGGTAPPPPSRPHAHYNIWAASGGEYAQVAVFNSVRGAVGRTANGVIVTATPEGSSVSEDFRSCRAVFAMGSAFQQSPARPGPGPWAQGPARTQPVQINDMVAQARPGPYNISPSHYHIYLTIVIKAPMTYF